MIRSLSTAGTGMVSQQYNLDTIANNLANVNTTSFKQQRAEFQDLMYQTFRASGATAQGDVSQPNSLQLGLGSRFASTATNFAMGTLQPTGNPLDLAINGNGFFQVQKSDGSIVYTRDGSFKVNANGQIVTGDGYLLEPGVEIPVGTTAVSISASGVVSGIRPGESQAEDLGQIQIAVFANQSGLTRIGQNLYQAGGASGEPQLVEPGAEGSGTIQGGHLEGSNVQVVEEMVKMILAQRAYEINSKAIQTADDMLSILNNLKR